MRKILIEDGNADVSKDESQFNQRETTGQYRVEMEIWMTAA